MASVNTNVAAITALRTLQQTNNQLDSTQARISTGLKIGEAKDNAAYWAISTTLKSDNKSLGTVKDALGLGSATVDVAYQGLNKAKDVLDTIKSKLTAATQAGVDKNVIQSEITELQKQLTSIASSSVFSGENWLSVDSSSVDYDSTKKIVASFARDADNSVSIGTVDVAIGNVALFDSSTVKDKNGILDGMQNLKGSDGKDLAIGGIATSGNINKAGLVDATGTATSAAVNGVNGVAIKGATYAAGTFASADTEAAKTLSFNLTVDGGSATPVTVATTAGMTAAAFKSALQLGINNAVGANKVLVDIGAGNAITFQTTSINGTGSALTIGTITTDGTAGKLGGLTGAGGSANGTNATYAVATAPGATDLTGLAAGDKMAFTLNVNGTAITKTVTLATTDVTDLAALLDTAFSGSVDVAETVANSNILRFTSTTGAAGADSTLSLTAVKITDAAGNVKLPTNATNLPLVGPAVAKTASFSAIALDDNDNLYFNIQADEATGSKLVTIDKALINKTLSTPSAAVTDGAINNIADFRKVVAAAMANANVTGVSVVVGSSTDNDKLLFTSNSSAATAKVAISQTAASGGANQISIDKLDISDAGLAGVGASSGDQISSVLKAYITVVNNAINKVTTAAANLGAVSSRIDMQKSFVNTLMDTIDKGIGGLIDADMSEESTKLQALQTKQQLGVQALSIANQSSQNILRLFQ